MKQRVNKDSFEHWNEMMAIKFNPDLFHRHSSPLVRWIEWMRVKKVISFLNPNDGEKILEVGCGAGNVMEKIKCGSLTGVDLSSYLLKKAEKKLGKRAKLIKADAENLPFENGYFDKVICTEVIEHVLNPRNTLEEIWRVLKPSGIFVLTIPNDRLIKKIKYLISVMGTFSALLGRKFGYKEIPEKMDDEWHLHAYDLREIKKMLASSFSLMRIEKIPRLFFPLHYAIRGVKKYSDK